MREVGLTIVLRAGAEESPYMEEADMRWWLGAVSVFGARPEND